MATVIKYVVWLPIDLLNFMFEIYEDDEVTSISVITNILTNVKNYFYHLFSRILLLRCFKNMFNNSQLDGDIYFVIFIDKETGEEEYLVKLIDQDYDYILDPTYHEIIFKRYLGNFWNDSFYRCNENGEILRY